MEPTLFLSTTRPGLTRAELVNGVWQTESLLPTVDVRCLAHDPHHPNTILAGTQGVGILRSSDRGRTWRDSTVGLERTIIKSIAFSPLEDVVFAGSKPAMVWRSFNGGRSWEACTGFERIPSRSRWWSPAEPPGTAYVQGLAVSPLEHHVILAGIEFGAVVISIDGGDTWSDHLPDAIHDCHTLIFHPKDGTYAYEGGGSGRGGAISRDGGESWTQPDRGLKAHYGWAVAADPADPEIWYVSVSPGPHVAHAEGTAKAAIYRATKKPGGWRRLTGGLPNPIPDMPYALLAPDPGELVAGLRSGEIWRSTDYGESWVQLALNMGRIDYGLLML